jgi:hypothetical protein
MPDVARSPSDFPHLVNLTFTHIFKIWHKRALPHNGSHPGRPHCRAARQHGSGAGAHQESEEEAEEGRPLAAQAAGGHSFGTPGTAQEPRERQALAAPFGNLHSAEQSAPPKAAPQRADGTPLKRRSRGTGPKSCPSSRQDVAGCKGRVPSVSPQEASVCIARHRSWRVRNAPPCVECTCCRSCDIRPENARLGPLERLSCVELQTDCAGAVNPDGCHARNTVLTVHCDMRSTICSCPISRGILLRGGGDDGSGLVPVRQLLRLGRKIFSNKAAEALSMLCLVAFLVATCPAALLCVACRQPSSPRVPALTKQRAGYVSRVGVSCDVVGNTGGDWAFCCRVALGVLLQGCIGRFVAGFHGNRRGRRSAVAARQTAGERRSPR